MWKTKLKICVSRREQITVTIICYKSGVIAADSCVTSGYTYYGNAIKIARSHTDGSLAGACGMIDSVAAFLRWCEGGRRGAKPNLSEDKEFCGIFINPKEVVSFYESAMYPYHTYNEFYAIGSGAEVAMGAMAIGADAVRACKVACKFIVSCREPIYALRLDGEAHRLNPPRVT